MTDVETMVEILADLGNVEVFVDYDARVGFNGDSTDHAIGLGGRVAF